MSNGKNQVELRWRRHTIDAIGLALDINADGPAPSEGAAGGIRYLIQEHAGIKIGVWAGPGRDLQGWRDGFTPGSARLGQESAITVCGTPARRQEAQVAGQTATGVYRDPAGNLGHIDGSTPATVSVGIAFTVRGQPVLVEWAVPAADRDRHRDAEAHFVASLACP